MTGQKHRIGLEEMGFNPTTISWAVVPDHGIRQDAGCSSGGKPCMECDCCKFWTGAAVQIADEKASAKDTIQKLQDNEATLEGKNQQLTKENVSAKDTIQKLQASESALKSDNEHLKKANKRLNAKNNNIRTVPDKERTSTGKIGRPRGGKATKNVRPERIDRKETVDVTKCSKNHNLSDKVKSYTKVVKVLHVWVEHVEYTINRRWCKKCDKYISAKPPGVPKHSRISANYSSLATWMQMNGLSHGKVIEFFTDVAKDKTSRSWSYRSKIKTANTLEPEHKAIKQDILDKPYLSCDELWWKIPGEDGGKVMVVRAEDMCLAQVVWSANIEAVKEMLPEYKGTIGQDSNPIWAHTGGDRQYCKPHQRRLSKKDLLHRDLKGDPLKFLTDLYHLDCKDLVYDKIEDPHTRRVAARCLEKERSELLNGKYEDDEDGTIAKRQKRHRREGWFMTTHMYKKNVPPDNNGVEQVNRRFVAVRNDGGGNRTQKGMDANSILFTIYATDWINGNSFFDHLVRAASGDG